MTIMSSIRFQSLLIIAALYITLTTAHQVQCHVMLPARFVCHTELDLQSGRRPTQQGVSRPQTGRCSDEEGKSSQSSPPYQPYSLFGHTTSPESHTGSSSNDCYNILDGFRHHYSESFNNDQGQIQEPVVNQGQ